MNKKKKNRCPFGCERFVKLIKCGKYTDIKCKKCGLGRIS